MSELAKKYDNHHDKKGTSNDDSTNNKVSSSKACSTKVTERQRKHPRSDEGCSRHIPLNQNQQSDIPKPKEKEATALVPIRYIPDLKNKHQRDQFDAIKVGMKFTGVVDGSFPGGYFITVGVGNCPTLSGVAMLNSDQPAQIERDVNENVALISTNIGLTQENWNENNNYPRNTRNPNPGTDINMDKIPPGLKVGDELISEYSESELLRSQEVQIPYKPVVLKPVNPSTGEPINQTNFLDKGKFISKEYYSAPTGCGIMIDPFLHRNFSSSALSITPPSDQVAASSFYGKTPTAELQLGINSSSLKQNTSQHVLSKNIESRNFLQHQLEYSQNQVVNTTLATNLEDRLMRVPGSNNIFGEKGSSSDKKGNNNVIKLMDEQQSDHAQPNSSSPTSKKSKHMQDNN
ncbi:hypothetical protein TSUD_127100 [Trifolium subterraneum]|nr:hypothetical protein TSUD_127100 [Trifolium subterraneum]